MLTRVTVVTCNCKRDELRESLAIALPKTHRDRDTSTLGAPLLYDEPASVSLTPDQGKEFIEYLDKSSRDYETYSFWSDDQFPYGRTRCGYGDCNQFATGNYNGTDTCNNHQ